jgi:hypothetical protein
MQTQVHAASVTLRWDYSASGAAGFMLYCGSSSRSYSTRIDVGNTDTYAISTLPVGATSFCAVTAYDSAKAESTYSNEISVSVPSAGGTADGTVPKVAITAPSNGATLVGTTTVSANASDNVGVVGVQFLLDGAALGAERLGPPFSLTWDTKTVANGAHALSARVRDGAGNTGLAATVSVTVSNPQTTGLVAAYSFREGAGTTVADASGNGNTGTISGATWTAQGRFGSALSFNGVNNWVSVNDASVLDLTTAMTLEAWVYPTTTTGVRDIVMKEGASDIYNLYARNWRGLPEANVLVGGSNRTAEGAVLAANVWTHVAGTYDGTTIRLYINGVEVANAQVSGVIAASTGPLRIGGNSLWGEFFQGQIDEVRVYNRVLTQAQIQSDMKTAVSP